MLEHTAREFKNRQSNKLDKLAKYGTQDEEKQTTGVNDKLYLVIYAEILKDIKTWNVKTHNMTTQKLRLTKY